MKERACILVGMLLISALIPLTASAGDPNDPEVTDRIRDVRGFFGLIPRALIPQFFLKHVDIQSAWFYEDSNNPDYLSISLKVRDLEVKLSDNEQKTYDTIYTVRWYLNDEFYVSGLHVFSDGHITEYSVGKESDENYFVLCQGTFEEQENIITWLVPKDGIGNPQPGDVLLRPWAWIGIRIIDNDTGNYGGELVKDWTSEGREYTIQY